MSTARSTIAFLEATRLEENSYEEYEFSSKKEADSFRVALYAEKRRLMDNTVLISISGTVIRLTKKGAVYTKRAFNSKGEEVTKEVLVEGISDYEKKVNEILELAEEFESEEKKAMFIADSLTTLHSRRRTR